MVGISLKIRKNWVEFSLGALNVTTKRTNDAM